MLFNSLEFLVYFPVVVGLYFLLPHRWRWLHLLVASYVFYMAWEPAYALLILASTVVDYFAAQAMPSAGPTAKRRLLYLSLATNLGLLSSFKYYDFINGTLRAVLGGVGIDWGLPEYTILLPVGISFYTFQTLAYTIDVYRGKLKPEEHFGHFALYVSYFPQLVAGPIERAGRLLPQLRARHDADPTLIASGLRLMLWGLFKKVVIADRMASIIDPIFASPHDVGGFLTAIACFGFIVKVYFDFSGYTDLAIGAARVMGVHLVKNFDQPFLAQSVNEFWSRWHISIMAWFRDYIYIPLGGSREGAFRKYVNIMVVFMVSGLWHGAAWTFVVWGALNGLYSVVGVATADARERIAVATGWSTWTRTRIWWRRFATFALIGSTMQWFAAPDVDGVLAMYQNIGVGWGSLLQPARWDAITARFGMDGVIFWGTLMLAPVGLVMENVRARYEAKDVPTLVLWLCDWLLIVGTLWLGRFSQEAFVYFQF